MLRHGVVSTSAAVVDVTAVDRVYPRREMSPDCVGNPVLDLWHRNADDRSGLFPASRQRRARHIVAPAPSTLGRMAGAHPVSAVVMELTHKNGMIVGLGRAP